MKKILVYLLLVTSLINLSFANSLSQNSLPHEFYIREHWISLTSSYDIETKTEKLGTLYRKFFSFLLTYEFFDPRDNKIASAREKFFSLTPHFDIYDNNEVLLGSVDERFLVFFPTFDLYAPDNSRKLAQAVMNFWGTTFTIYDPETDQEMATLHRPFFRLKNDWTFKATNAELLDKKNIDPRLFMTVIAFQGDIERWIQEQNRERDNRNYLNVDGKRSTNPTEQEVKQAIKADLNKIKRFSQKENINLSKNLNHKALNQLAQQLEAAYQEEQGKDHGENPASSIHGFVDFCLNYASTENISVEKKAAILFMLKTRLQAV